MSPPLLNRETPFVIVFNAASGSGDARRAQAEMTEVLNAGHQEHEFFVVEDPKQLQDLARRAAEKAVQRNGAVIVAGGDGTINAVAQATLKTGRPFGIVPQGTFNYTTRARAIPLDTALATHALLNARLSAMQVGLVNEKVFLVNASLGLYPQLLEERETYKSQYGRTRGVALWAGLRTLLRDHRQLTLEIEHDTERELVRTTSLFVGNNPLQLEQAGLPEAQAVQRRRLAAVIVKPRKTRSLLWLAARGALGQLGGAANVRNFAFKRLVVSPARGNYMRPFKVATDGEICFMQPPLVFRVASESLWLMTPAAESESTVTPVASGSGTADPAGMSGRDDRTKEPAA
ncbi:MAG TPA: diacylglycerol kinase family protein [Polyangiaceae bacterium]|nr:diacylglycerol kinase family protein [Polyangiaceae bacterium]